MGDMGRPLYLQLHKTRHGKDAWYVRLPRSKLVRILGEYGTEAFWEQYRAALAGAPIAKPAPNSKSLQWLYDRYRESSAWASLSPATKRQRENILGNVMAKSGHEPFAAISRADIEGGKDDRRETPAQARNFLDAMRGLFRWAVKNEHVETDPTSGVDNPQRLSGGPGFPVWDETDVAAYQAKWPVGTRERVWLDVLLYTGLRRGDAVRIGWANVKDGLITIKTQKTGMEVHVPLLPPLAATLKAGPCAPFHYICGESGKPLTKESFGNLFKKACVAAGITKAAHGVRKLAATRMANNGASERELEAMFGWTGGFMASLYTRSADRKRLAKGAAAKLIVLPEKPGVLPQKSRNKSNSLEGAKASLVRSRKVP